MRARSVGVTSHVKFRTAAPRMSVPQHSGKRSAARQGVVINHVDARPVSKALVHSGDDG